MAGMFLFVIALNCKDAPKDQTAEKEGETLIQETLPPVDSPGDEVQGGAMDPSKTTASPLPDTIDAPEGKSQGDT